jgi:hypothetical protein
MCDYNRARPACQARTFAAAPVAMHATPPGIPFTIS